MQIKFALIPDDSSNLIISLSFIFNNLEMQ